MEFCAGGQIEDARLRSYNQFSNISKKFYGDVSLYWFQEQGVVIDFCHFEIYNYTYNIHTYNMRIDSNMNYYYYD